MARRDRTARPENTETYFIYGLLLHYNFAGTVVSLVPESGKIKKNL
jgi:hypothetical protein